MPYTVDAVKQLLKKEIQINKNLPLPKQSDIDELYQSIYEYMSFAKKEAEKTGKPPLFVIGEIHTVGLGRNSLVVKGIFLKVAKRLGLKNCFIEAGQKDLNMRLQLADAGKNLKNRDPQLYKEFSEDMDISVSMLMEGSFYGGFNVVPTETMYINDSAEREKNICNTVVRHQIAPALLTVGAKHLKGISTHKELNKYFNVYLASSETPDMGEKLMDLSGISKTNNLRNDFAWTSKSVKQFWFPALNLLGVTPDDLLEMIKRAQTTHIRLTSETVYLDKQKKAFTNAPYSAPQLMSSKSVLVSQGPTQNRVSAEKASNDNNNGNNMAFPFDVPIALLTEIGFWIASKNGLCEKSSSATTFIFSNSIAENLYQEQQQEASAELQLKKKGLSLEAALQHLFVKKYTQGTEQEQQQQRRFIIEMINGDFKNDIREKFEELTTIQNDHERSKQIYKFMLNAEKSREEEKAENSWRYGFRL